MTEEVTHNLFMAGQLLGAVLAKDNPRELKILCKNIDPDVLQGYLDSKPEGFLYAEQVQQSIRLARTFKSLGKG